MNKKIVVAIAMVGVGLSIALKLKAINSPARKALREEGPTIKGITDSIVNFLKVDEGILDIWRTDGKGVIILATNVLEVTDETPVIAGESVFEYLQKSEHGFNIVVSVKKSLQRFDAIRDTLLRVGFNPADETSLVS